MPEKGDPSALLHLALEALAGGLPLTHLDERTRARIWQEARRWLSRISVTERGIGGLCNSNWWDHMPQALASVCGRPLRIYSGDARGRQVMVRTVGETEQRVGEDKASRWASRHT